ncbi:hypothetical protein [Nodularia sp. NIES-3585]|uniref:hypothetical protein n=1 Tax=Nodularia sp. NIES-3585 TaxID=1973477 RepID=UPI000B5CAA0A|nr:hypothetical protein [Nodularia sp. NIES-3585]GAX36787.1 hypothetical protein NIES3585_28240 [Nodularia sp. NIES-3585]
MNNLATKEINLTSEVAGSLDAQEPLLPRSAWNSQLVYLRLVFRAKKALDKIEQEAGVFKNE